MTRKDYEATARALREAVALAYNYADNFREGELAYRQGIECAYEEVVCALSHMFANDNPRFSLDRWLAATGRAHEEVE